MKFRLDERIASLQDYKAMILEVRAYARWLSHTTIKKQLKISPSAEEPSLSEASKALLHEWSTTIPLSQRRLDELVATLEEFIHTAPQITITLAALPTPTLKKTIVAWCREQIAPNVLVNVQFSSAILGGMVLRAGSRIFDWSFRRQILEASSRFPEVLRRV